MQDIIKKYRKHKKITNLGIVLTSLVIAFGVNFLLIDGTVTGQNLKASILNANNVEINSDVYFDLEDDKIILKTSKIINNIKNLSFSITYNPENVEIIDIVSSNNLSEISNEEGIKSIIINFEAEKNINPNESILEINTNKKVQKSENINIINSNFTDNTGENYMLSSSGITF